MAARRPPARSGEEDRPAGSTGRPEGGAAPPPVPATGWASPRTFLMLGVLAVGLVGVALLAAFQGPLRTADGALHFGWLSLLPAIVTVVLAFTTRQVLLALILGVTTGSIVYSFGSSPDCFRSAAGCDGVLGAFTSFEWLRLNTIQTFFIPEMGTSSFAAIIVLYLWCLGGLIGLWSRTGGAVRFAVSIGRIMVRGPRTAKLFAWLLGLLFHQGGNISTVLAGTTARPVLDQHPIPKEESAYIVDSTATSAATLIGLNAWPIFIASVAAGTVAAFPTEASVITHYFPGAILWNWYGILAVLSTLLLALGLLPPIFSMKKARRRVAETGETVRPGSQPLAAKELTELHIPPGYKTGLADFLVPMMFLVGITVGPLLIRAVVAAMTDTVFRPVVYITEAFFVAIVVAVLIAVIKGMPVRTALEGVLDGSKGVTIAIIILGIAVSLKGVAQALGTGTFVAAFLGDMPAMLVAPLLMFAAMVIAFSTGTSFGTFAVMFPVALPLAEAVDPGNATLMSMSFGAVIGGSIFGDQTSPISDTTILSSLAIGCDVLDHVLTQIPYALIAALIAATGYLVTGAILF